MKKVLFAVMLLVFLCMPLIAQDTPKAEVFGGYQLLRDDDISIHGFTAAVEGNINEVFGVVGDFGFGIKDIGQEDNYKAISFAGGPRFSYRQEKFRLFANALFGAVRESISQSDTNFVMSFGGGIDFAINESISVRPAQFDIYNIKYTGAWDSGLRYSAGIVFKLGSKGN